MTNEIPSGKDVDPIPTPPSNFQNKTVQKKQMLTPGTPINQPAPLPPDPFIAEFEAFMAKIIPQASPLLKTTIDFLDSYIKDLDPVNKNIDPIAGATIQERFMKVLVKLINESPSETFNRNWTVVLSYFWRYRTGALGDRYVNRFPASWNANDTGLQVFQNIVALCSVSANPATRRTAGQRISITRAISKGLLPSGITNLTQFYRI